MKSKADMRDILMVIWMVITSGAGVAGWIYVFEKIFK